MVYIGLGAPYGWSAISASLTREFGFVSCSAADWGLANCTYPMSIMVSIKIFCITQILDPHIDIYRVLKITILNLTFRLRLEDLGQQF